MAQEMANDPNSYLANPVAVELGLHDTTGPGQSRLITSGPNPAKDFYDYLLVCCEQLFDNEMEQSIFEDNLRFMFGIKAYLLFTVDKVVAAIIKQVRKNIPWLRLWLIISVSRCNPSCQILRAKSS
jgi:paired amphipathic helix protein Sin3a